MWLDEPREPRRGNCLPQREGARDEEHRSDNRSESGVLGRAPAGQRCGMGTGKQDAGVGMTTTFVITDPGEVWKDEEGVVHIQNRRTRVEHEGDIEGLQFRLASLNV